MQAALWHLQEQIPRGLAYEWHALAQRLTPPPDADAAWRESLRAITELEAVRVLGRKRGGDGTALQDDVGREMQAFFRRDLDKWQQDENANIKTGAANAEDVPPLDHLADELIIASVFADAMRLAYGRPDAIAAARTTLRTAREAEATPIPTGDAS